MFISKLFEKKPVLLLLIIATWNSNSMGNLLTELKRMEITFLNYYKSNREIPVNQIWKKNNYNVKLALLYA